MLAIPRFGCINVHAIVATQVSRRCAYQLGHSKRRERNGPDNHANGRRMDTGPMLAKRSIAIGDRETAPELSARLSRVGAELLSETLPRIERGEIKPLIQDDNQATYARCSNAKTAELTGG